MTSDRNLSLPPGHSQGAEVDIQKIVETEMARIRSQDKRTEAFNNMLALQDEQDRRQFEFAKLQLETHSKNQAERFNFFKKCIVVAALLTVLIITILFCVLFMGSEKNAQIAKDILILILAALAGGGTVSSIRKIWEKWI